VKRILLLINPRARSGSDKYLELKAAIENNGHQVIELSHNEQNGNFKDLVLKYKSQTDIVIIGGGDGTINFVLPSLVEAKLPLILFPMGTANLLARSFDIKTDINQLLSAINDGKKIAIDLGIVNGIYFINVCGLGISTEVNKQVTPRLKKLTGPFSFWLTGLKLSNRFKPFKMKLTVDGKEPITTKTWQITICNGKKYAAWMTIEEDASYDDGTLRCLSTEIQKWYQGFRLLPYYMKGSYHEDLEVNFLSGKEITIETKKPLLIDVDGDVQTRTPATFKVKSRALKLILPPDSLSESTPISNQSL